MSVANEVDSRPTVSPEAKGQVERDRLRMMMLIRRFEEKTYQQYTSPTQGIHGEKILRIGGFCHLYSGQEAVAVGVAALFQKGKDYLINGYRDHGHSLALGMEPGLAMAEMFGRATGCSRGKGGSMHFFDAEVGNLGGHGIVGGHIPLGAGAAFAAMYKKTGGVCFTIFGDGAVNQGTFNETLNLASLWKLPAIFIVENNGVAMGTQVERASAEKDLAKRGLGYNMPVTNLDGNDIDAVIEIVGGAADRARKGQGPSYISANTYRFRGHSMSDPLKYRSKEEAEAAKQRDPILIYEKRLRDRKLIEDEWVEQTEGEVRQMIDDAVKFADESPHPDTEEMYTDTLSETYPLQK